MAFEEKPPGVKEIFRTHWTIWKWMGQVAHPEYPKLQIAYTILMNITFSICYPVHLVIGQLKQKTLQETLLNLTITVPSIVCCLKYFNIWRNLGKVRHLEQMFNILYARIDRTEDWIYYRKVTVPYALRVLHVFYFICVGMAITAELSVLFMGFAYEWRLMYPGYFPFDPYATTVGYVAAHVFQIIGFAGQLTENLVNDTYGAMCLSLLVGHAHLLGQRLARIGYDKRKTHEENNQELVNCIVDHNMIFNCQRTLGGIIGLGMFAQIISASLCMGIVIIYAIFFVDNAMEYAYYGIFLFGCIMEVFPTCYYATYFEFEFENLTYKMFSCNWMDQNREFKKNLIVCVEQSLKKRYVLISGMIRINLQIFFAICKGAYSVLTLALNFK